MALSYDGRRHFSFEDDKSLYSFLLEKIRNKSPLAQRPCGNELWKLAEQEKISGHSYQAMLGRMRKKLLPNLDATELLNDEEKGEIKEALHGYFSPNRQRTRRDPASGIILSQSDIEFLARGDIIAPPRRAETDAAGPSQPNVEHVNTVAQILRRFMDNSAPDLHPDTQGTSSYNGNIPVPNNAMAESCSAMWTLPLQMGENSRIDQQPAAVDDDEALAESCPAVWTPPPSSCLEIGSEPDADNSDDSIDDVKPPVKRRKVSREESDNAQQETTISAWNVKEEPAEMDGNSNVTDDPGSSNRQLFNAVVNEESPRQSQLPLDVDSALLSMLMDGSIQDADRLREFIPKIEKLFDLAKAHHIPFDTVLGLAGNVKNLRDVETLIKNRDA